MRVLVTGGSGFVGRSLVPELARVHEVYSLLRGASGVKTPDVNIVNADLTAPDFVDRLPRVDAIVHLAQAYQPFPGQADDLFLVNTVSTHWLAEYARRTGVTRFVYTSSGSVYAPSDSPLHEHSPTVPVGYHPTTKLLSEMLLHHYAHYFSIAVLRLFAPYGPGQVDRLIPRLIETVRSRQVIRLSHGGEPRLNPIYISDLVDVLMMALQESDTYTLNIAGPDTASIRDLGEVIGKHVELEPIFEKHDVGPRGSYVADVRAMNGQFGTRKLVGLTEGLRRTIHLPSIQPNAGTS